MLLLAWLAGCACNDAETDVAPPPVPSPALPDFVPAAATIHRLTDAEWRNAVEDLLGVRYEGVLPLDYVLHGYTRVGGSELTVGVLDFEQYEAAAWTVAQLAVPDPVVRDALFGCDAADPVCARGFASTFATRAWRRPLDADDLDEFEDLAAEVTASIDAEVAARAVIVAVLLSPNFLFRVEVGEAEPDHPEWRRYTSVEMAGRLASFLTASVPDEALLQAGLDGSLLDTDTLLTETRRLVDTPRGQAALSAFFAETLELQNLDTVTKDEAIYPQFTDALRTEMALELNLLFSDVLDRDADVGELLTTSTTFVGPELAALYQLPGVPGTTRVTISDSQDRGGILGRAALLSLHAHNTLTSPTKRGKYVQTRLLCRSIPPPPAGIDTTLEDSDEGTLRDQLEQHATDPVCNSCHEAMDPLGFALEHFDPIGGRRELDNGLPIDATGTLDGIPFDGASELGAVVAAHPDFAGCIALQLYRSASGQAERDTELLAVEDLTAAFVDEGRVMRALVEVLVTSDAFRLASGPLQEVCTVEGDVRDCATDCGSGVEVCADGRWRGCTALAPGVETCDGADQDCDGLVDERLERSCDDGPGTQACSLGTWTACAGPTGDEICNGLDDDGDGEIDDGLEVAVVPFAYVDLVAAHYACDPLTDADSPACRAAAHRACGADGCSATGFGPLELRSTDADLVCLDTFEGRPQAATFTALSVQHAGCNATSRQGPDCNAAIHRTCAAQGLVSGYGPVENGGDDATIVCTPGAAMLGGSYAVLSTYEAECNESTRAGAACNRAIAAWCIDQSYETGHGPVENAGDLAIVACLGSP